MNSQGAYFLFFWGAKIFPIDTSYKWCMHSWLPFNREDWKTQKRQELQKRKFAMVCGLLCSHEEMQYSYPPSINFLLTIKKSSAATAPPKMIVPAHPNCVVLQHRHYDLVPCQILNCPVAHQTKAASKCKNNCSLISSD